MFGFLAYDEPKIDGNFGLKDQCLALQWVQDNTDLEAIVLSLDY